MGIVILFEFKKFKSFGYGMYNDKFRTALRDGGKLMEFNSMLFTFLESENIYFTSIWDFLI